MQGSFDFKDKYPYKAGHRNVDTSIKSAEKINKHLKRIIQCGYKQVKTLGLEILIEE